MRYFLEIAYHGKKYHGWQVQKNAHAVQQELNAALQQLLGVPVETIGSGRTDTGVHAEQQFVQLDFDGEMTPGLLFKLNRILPFDIAILGVRQVKEEAHVRFDAYSRTYEYRISRTKNPFLTDLAYHFSKELDLIAMNKACALLMKHEDFESFSKVKTEVGHFRCDITQAFWKEEKDLLIFTIQANRFLRGMVRAITGTMIEIGLGRMSRDQFEAIIKSKDRKEAGSAAPPHGLFLTSIMYPEEIFIGAAQGPGRSSRENF